MIYVLCIRCREYIETWEHIWICQKNKHKIIDIIEENNKKFVNGLRENNIGELMIKLWVDRMNKELFERSADKKHLIIYGVIRGIINKRIYRDEINNKVIKEKILEWIKNIHKDIREKIWNYRCEKMKEKEKELQIVINKRIGQRNKRLNTREQKKMKKWKNQEIN